MEDQIEHYQPGWEDAARLVLRPCPFCGGKAHFETVTGSPNPPHSDEGGRFVECTKCLAATKLMFPCKESVDEQLAETWNMRAWDTPEAQVFEAAMRMYVCHVSAMREHGSDSSIGVLAAAEADLLRICEAHPSIQAVPQ